ncbi:MAG TPA: hypothetical protein VFJ82_21665 [Longimicrobium sp.]|nr:hypothetical protein [Longimicrobium sp.]
MCQQLTPEALRAMSGVSRIPRPVDESAFLSAVKRHTPAVLRGRRRAGFVLLDVVVDANGEVRDVTAVSSPSGPAPEAVRVRGDGSGGEAGERLMAGSSDPVLGPAAEAALREVKFTPAVRDGVAVPFTLRMSIRFGA